MHTTPTDATPPTAPRTSQRDLGRHSYGHDELLACGHGELFGPQMFFFRPAPGWNQYRTPIEGYYQCGSGTHPGGCVTGGPARLASRQILKDLDARRS